jgi:hypothetical protein
MPIFASGAHAITTPHPRKRSTMPRYTCSEPPCDYSTNIVEHFRSHMRGHTGDMLVCPYPGCGREGLYLANMTQHMNAVHLGKKPFPCDTCLANFSLASNLAKHARTHLPPAFSCAESGCAATFRTCLDTRAAASSKQSAMA